MACTASALCSPGISGWFWGTKSFNLWVMKADGSNLVQLTDHSNFVGSPTWGQDEAIYFHTYGSGFLHRDNWDIWSVKPELLSAPQGLRSETKSNDNEK